MKVKFLDGEITKDTKIDKDKVSSRKHSACIEKEDDSNLVFRKY